MFNDNYLLEPDIVNTFKQIESIFIEINNVCCDLKNPNSIKKLFWELLSFNRAANNLENLWADAEVSPVYDLKLIAEYGDLKIIKGRLKEYGSRKSCIDDVAQHIGRIFPSYILFFSFEDSSDWFMTAWLGTNPALRGKTIITSYGSRITDSALKVLAGMCAYNLADYQMLNNLLFMQNVERVLIAAPEAQFENKRNLKHSGSNGIDWYLNEIGRYKLLTPNEELSLACNGNRRKKNAFDKLVCCNLRFVVSVAKQYRNMGILLEDLIQEGNLGLITAVNRFDATKGFKLISYAVWWIRQRILQALSEQGRTVRIPLNREGARIKVEKAERQLGQELMREASPYEISEKIGLDVGEVLLVSSLSQPEISIDAPLDDYNGNSLLSVLPNENNVHPGNIDKNNFTSAIHEILNDLEEREKNIVCMYFGLGFGHEMTLEAIGEYYGLTRERIRQIKDKAMSKLIHRSRKEKLKKWLSGEWNIGAVGCHMEDYSINTESSRQFERTNISNKRASRNYSNRKIFIVYDEMFYLSYI